MFSGEDSSGDALNNAGQFATWAISQTTCNPGNDQVDWAALAQQWIQMKESASYAAPPILSPAVATTGLPSINSYEEEKGEADMEVVKDDENGFPENAISASSTTSENYTNPIYRVQPEWQSSWFPDQSQWRSGWNNWPSGNQPTLNLNEINAPPAPSMTITKATSPPNKGTTPEPVANVSSVTSAEAVRRKTLPAWIREGLEKMEKEKLKQIEKQKDCQPRTNLSDVINKNLNVSPERLANDIIKVRNEQSLQESDNSGDENAPDHQADSDSQNEDDIDGDHVNSPPASSHRDKPIVTKSHEELLEEWMLVVRRSLTELLLEVTNEEINIVAHETLRKTKVKASSAQVFRKSAISSITGKLGLGAYADSASENSESEEDDNHDPSDRDSEDEIRELIRSRQNAFKAVAQEIEQTARESEREPRRTTDHDVDKTPSELKSSKKGYDIDSGEPQPDKKSQHNGKRPRERTSRFSDVKDLKSRANVYTLVPPTPTPSSSANDFEPRKQSSSLTTSTTNLSSASKSKRYSDTSSSSSDSSDSYHRRRHRRTNDKSYKSSSNGNSSSRRERDTNKNIRNSSDSDEYSSRRSKKYSSSRSTYSKDRSRSRTRSRSRSRSRSQSYTGKTRH